MDIVKRDDLLEKHEVDVLEILLVLCVELKAWLAVFDVVIAEISYQTARKTRETIKLRRAVAAHHLADIIGGVPRLAGLRFARADVLHSHHAVKAGYLELGVVSEECVPSPLLLVFHALENVAVTADILQYPQYLDRGPDIRKNFAADGDKAVARQRLCFFNSRS